MKRGVSTILSLLLAWQVSGQNDVKQQLIKIFNEAEQCYLMDDYQQLKSCLDNYYERFYENIYDIDDSLDVFLAYYDKMYGA